MTDLPENHFAIFWDYENFQIPSDVSAEIFFNALFPDSNDLIVTKRVYGSATQIHSQLLLILQNHGFSYVKGLSTGKANSSDFIMYSDCIEFCTQHPPPLVVIIISGDVDFLPLVQKLSLQGHEVRLICQNKQKIHSKLHRTIPIIIDRKEILTTCKKLMGNLSTLSSVVNFLLSQNSDDEFSIGNFTTGIEDQTRPRRYNTLASRIKLLLKLPEYSWQYHQSSEGLLSHSELYLDPSSIDVREDVSTLRKILIQRLGSEANHDSWEDQWQAFQLSYPNVSDQERIVKHIYKQVHIPEIRNRLQRKLFEIVLQLEELEIKEEKVNKLLSLVQKDRSNVCEKCSREFSSQQALNQHIKDKHKSKAKKPIVCKICQNSFVNQQALQQHQQAKHSDSTVQTSLRCKHCNKDFISDLALLQHQEMKHGIPAKKVKAIDCPSCNKKFQTRIGLSQHIEKKH